MTEDIARGSVRWNELVQEVKAKGNDYYWAVADALLELFPIQEFRAREPIENDVCLFLADAEIPISYPTARQYRGTASKWPKSKRVSGVPFAVHLRLAGHPQRFSICRPGMAYAEAQQAMQEYRSTTDRTATNVFTTREEAELARRYQSENISFYELGRQYGVDHKAVQRAIERHENRQSTGQAAPKVTRRIAVGGYTVTPEMHEFIKAQCAYWGLSEGAYIRDLISEAMRKADH